MIELKNIFSYCRFLKKFFVCLIPGLQSEHHPLTVPVPSKIMWRQLRNTFDTQKSIESQEIRCFLQSKNRYTENTTCLD
jgi:hypothetical protein